MEINASVKEVRQSCAQWFVKFREQALREYVAGAYAVYWDLQKSQPKSPLYWFIWLVKGHDDMTEYLEHPKEAIDTVERHLNRMTLKRNRRGERTPFGDGQSGDPWREWFGYVGEDARAEFYDTWQKIRYRPGHGPLEQAFTANVMARLLVHPDIRRKRPMARPEERSTRDYEFFIGLAGHLQVAMGVRAILLPVHDVAELMDVAAMTITRYRRWAVEDRYLVVTKKHRFKSGGGGKATEFRVNLTWPGLKDRITTGVPAIDAGDMDSTDWNDQTEPPDNPMDDE